MSAQIVNIYLADDDDDDCLLFADVLSELPVQTILTTAANGAELMSALNSIANAANFPHLLFLDLNMPIKNGLECLAEIKASPKLHQLPVIMYSTSAQREAVDSAYMHGAALFVKKPDSFAKLKRVLLQILALQWDDTPPKRDRTEFLIDV